MNTSINIIQKAEKLLTDLKKESFIVSRQDRKSIAPVEGKNLTDLEAMQDLIKELEHFLKRPPGLFK